MVNLGFGDLSPDNSIDDKIKSNNGDIVKVLATVVDILRHYTSQHPRAEIFFKGSTEERTKLYSQILRRHYSMFSREFEIAGVLDTKNNMDVFPFDPGFEQDYFAFLIKRIS